MARYPCLMDAVSSDFSEAIDCVFSFKFPVICCIFSISLNSHFPHGLGAFGLNHFSILGAFHKNLLIPGGSVFIVNRAVIKSSGKVLWVGWHLWLTGFTIGRLGGFFTGTCQVYLQVFSLCSSVSSEQAILSLAGGCKPGTGSWSWRMRIRESQCSGYRLSCLQCGNPSLPSSWQYPQAERIPSGSVWG